MSSLRHPSLLSLPFLVLGETVNPNSIDIIEVAGRLDATRLRASIARATRKHPLLSGHFARRHRRYFWETDPNLRVPDLVFSNLDTDDTNVVTDHVLSNAWSQPLPNNTPVRFYIIETPQRTIIQTVCPHSITDARSGARLSADIVSSYTALEEGTPWDDRPIDVPDHSMAAMFGAGWARARMRHAAGAFGLTADDAVNRDMGLALPDAPRGRTRFVKIDLGSDFLEGLRSRGRATETTLHPMLLLAVLRAREIFNTRRNLPAVPFRFMDLYSLRGHLTSPNARELFDVLVTPHAMRMDPSWTDEEVITHVQGQTRSMRNGGVFAAVQQMAFFSQIPLPASWVLRGVTALTARTNIAITNPGVVPYAFERIGSQPILDFYNFPQLFSPARVMLIFSTFRGRMRMLMTYDEACFPDGIEELQTLLLDQLRALLDSGRWSRTSWLPAAAKAA